jgi:hypothetical protein
MLSVEDREFLFSIMTLTNRSACRIAREKADRALAGEIASMARLGTPAQREFCLRVAALPLIDNDCGKSIARAGNLLAEEVGVITQAKEETRMLIGAATSQMPAHHPGDRFE